MANSKIQKAKQMRLKKPIVKNLNLEYIMQELHDIQEECEEIRWFTDSDDAHTYCMRAWRSPVVERLWKILRETKWWRVK